MKCNKIPSQMTEPILSSLAIRKKIYSHGSNFSGFRVETDGKTYKFYTHIRRQEDPHK